MMNVKKENKTNESKLLIFKAFRGGTGYNSKLVIWLYSHKDSNIEKIMMIGIVLSVCFLEHLSRYLLLTTPSLLSDRKYY